MHDLAIFDFIINMQWTLVVCGLSVTALAAWWRHRVRSIRAKYVHAETGQLIPGSNNFPFVDYIIHGFHGRNTLAPYGELELSFFLGMATVMVSDPRVIQEMVRGAKFKLFDKGEFTVKGTEPLAGRENLFSSDGPVWQHQRAVINPAFRPNMIRMLRDVVESTVAAAVDGWVANGPPESLEPAISRLTLDILMRAAFGLSDNENVTSSATTTQLMEQYNVLLHNIMYTVLGVGGLIGANAKIQKASAFIEGYATQVLAAARSHAAQEGPSSTAAPPSSLIAMLLEAHKHATPDDDCASGGNVPALTDRQIIDNIKIFLFAGHDSTATTISWVLFLLALHPHYIPACRDDDAMLHAVVQEALRLFPPAWAINRSNKEDVVLGGYSFPKGTSIMINTLRLHRRPDLGWERPLEFMPERWLADQPHAAKAACCFMPFGGGPRSCVGQPLAELEIRTVLTKVLTAFDPAFVHGSYNDMTINFFSGATIRPKYMHNLRLLRRET